MLRAIATSFTALTYQGTWNASTNTPTLASGVGTKGYYYVVSVAGTTNLDGITNWGVGDWAVFNGTAWQRVEGGADGNFVNLTATGTTTLGPAATNLSISNTTIAAAGTNTNIDVNINAKGSGIAYLNQAWGVNASGTLVPASDNTYDIGNGLSNPRDLTVSRDVSIKGSLSLSGNISAPAWTTNGIRYKNVSVTLTDTTSSGTVAAAYTNVFGGNTIAASSATTFTDYASMYFAAPVAGTNVTISNKWSVIAQDKIKAAGFALSSDGIITEATTSRTLSATDNGKVIYCTSGSAVTITTATGLGAGFSVTIIQGGAGKVTVSQGASTTLVSYGSFYSTLGQYAIVSLICPVADTFYAAGNLGA